MPELPDITVYIEALRPRVVGRRLVGASIKGPFLLRTFDPSIDECVGRTVIGVERLGKRIVIELGGELFLVLHLMIAGRLLWKPLGRKPTGKIDLAVFSFERSPRTMPEAESSIEDQGGTLVLTEAGTKKRASLHVLSGRASLAALDSGGVEPLTCTHEQLVAALTRENRTLKRALTDPRNVSGIGNAYSDEILLAARLSPFLVTRSMTPQQFGDLHVAMLDQLQAWMSWLRADFDLPLPHGQMRYPDGRVPPPGIGRFPGQGEITAFRSGFGAHGRFGKPCPQCGTPIQRVVYAENEMNYCPSCQTGGKMLADRSLSRLLNEDWPRTLEELEEFGR